MADLVLTEKLVSINVEAAAKEDVFKILAQPLFDAGFVLPGFLEGVKEREKKFPTGLPTLPFGVAIPHTNPEYVKQNAVSIGVLKNPIEFTVMGTDDETVPVRVVFMLALNESQKQLNILRNITEIIRDEALLESFLSMNESEIYQLMKTKLERLMKNE